ncbi:efflux RND transporter permease subunit [Coprobacter sp.]
MENLSNWVFGTTFGYDWTREAYQETQASSFVTLIFGLAIWVVILVLAAQYESWTSSIG